MTGPTLTHLEVDLDEARLLALQLADETFPSTAVRLDALTAADARFAFELGRDLALDLGIERGTVAITHAGDGAFTLDGGAVRGSARARDLADALVELTYALVVI